MSLDDLVKSARKWAPILGFGVVFLYWQGYVYLSAYFLKFSIPPSWGALTFQEILISGVWPFLLLFLVGIVYVLKSILALTSLVGEIVSNNGILKFLPQIFQLVLVLLLLILLTNLDFLAKAITKCALLISRKFLSPIVRLHLGCFFKRTTTIFVPIIILLVLPSLAGYYSASHNFLSSQIRVDVEYQAPAISGYDSCGPSVCNGEYLRVFETSEYLYLVIQDDCGWVFDYPHGVCGSTALPKDRVLRIHQLISQ